MSKGRCHTSFLHIQYELLALNTENITSLENKAELIEQISRYFV